MMKSQRKKKNMKSICYELLPFREGGRETDLQGFRQRRSEGGVIYMRERVREREVHALRVSLTG